MNYIRTHVWTKTPEDKDDFIPNKDILKVSIPQIVAEKMCSLSQSHQILCITHLAQIASMSDTHFLIDKNVIENETYTSFTKLDKIGRTHELARMLGGVHVTETTLQHASEMLALADEYKKRTV